MCMTVGCNSQINFCHFFRSLNLVFFCSTSSKKHIDTGYLVNATPPTVLPDVFETWQVFL